MVAGTVSFWLTSRWRWIAIQVVPNYSKREDGYGETVAAVARVSAKELGDDFIVVFCIQQELPLVCLFLLVLEIIVMPKANWRIWLSRSYV